MLLICHLLHQPCARGGSRHIHRALGNVASTPENRLAIAEEGVCRPLITYIRNEDGDVIGRQYV